MQAMLSGGDDGVVIGAFLAALRTKGETAEEIAGFAAAMRENAVFVNAASGTEPVLDTCGTGGDGADTFNISTVAAFVAAGAGVRVAKHGNRSASSRCGSADVLEKLGITLIADPAMAARAIREVGIGFLFAPAFHPAMRHVMPVRRELKMRTVFNLLGPLANPARASHQLVGVSGIAEARLMAAALRDLGLTRGFVVHGSDGLDEVTTTGPTTVIEIGPGGLSEWQFSPQSVGIEQAGAEHLRGGDAEENAEIAREVLGGKPGPKRDIVLVNAAFAINAAGKFRNLRDSLSAARRSLDSGAALERLESLREFTSKPADPGPPASP